jgi:hypothetical protein
MTLADLGSNAIHFFAVEWDATSVRWYVDDLLIHSTKTTSNVSSGGIWVNLRRKFPGLLESRFLFDWL